MIRATRLRQSRCRLPGQAYACLRAEDSYLGRAPLPQFQQRPAHNDVPAAGLVLSLPVGERIQAGVVDVVQTLAGRWKLLRHYPGTPCGQPGGDGDLGGGEDRAGANLRMSSPKHAAECLDSPCRTG